MSKTKRASKADEPERVQLTDMVKGADGTMTAKRGSKRVVVATAEQCAADAGVTGKRWRKAWRDTFGNDHVYTRYAFALDDEATVKHLAAIKAKFAAKVTA